MKKILVVGNSIVAIFCLYHLLRIFRALFAGEGWSVNFYVYLLLGLFLLSLLNLYSAFKETGSLKNGNFIVLYMQRKALEEQRKINELKREAKESQL